MRTPEFGAALSEKAGYKSGLALDEPRLREFVAEGGFEALWPKEDGLMRIRSEEFEEVFAYVLYRLGIGPERFEPSPMIAVWHRIKDDPERKDLFDPVGQMFVGFMQSVYGPTMKLVSLGRRRSSFSASGSRRKLKTPLLKRYGRTLLPSRPIAVSLSPRRR